MDGKQVRIVQNLKGRVYAVNTGIALHGVEDGASSLHALVLNGTVEKSNNLYTLSFDARKVGISIRRVK